MDSFLRIQLHGSANLIATDIVYYFIIYNDTNHTSILYIYIENCIYIAYMRDVNIRKYLLFIQLYVFIFFSKHMKISKKM